MKARLATMWERVLRKFSQFACYHGVCLLCRLFEANLSPSVPPAKSRESGTRIRQCATCPVRIGRSTKRSDTETIECRRLSQINEGVDWLQYLVSSCLKWHSMLEAWSSTTHRGLPLSSSTPCLLLFLLLLIHQVLHISGMQKPSSLSSHDLVLKATDRERDAHMRKSKQPEQNKSPAPKPQHLTRRA